MANRMELRKINRNTIYRYLLGKPEMTKQEVALATNLSIPTVAQNLTDLMTEGFVESTGTLESTGGRRATGYTAPGNVRFAVGIDITQNHIIIAVINVLGEIIGITRREVFHFRDEDSCYARIAEKVNALLQQYDIRPVKLLGIGVSLPCIVDRERNLVTYSRIIPAPKNIAERLSAVLPAPVEIYNDANSAGFAELWKLQETGWESRDLFYLMLSNSVGGAMIRNSEIYLGDNCRSSEVGHFRLIPGGKRCYCGQNGCVNSYCSARLLSDHTGGELRPFFAALADGNKKFSEIFSEYLKYLTATVVNLRMLYDCDIILGGYVGEFIGSYLDTIREMLIEQDPYETDASYLTPCRFQLEASTIGAALTFVQKFIRNM